MAAAVPFAAADPASAKTPGTTYCYVGICHRVLTLEETRRQIGSSETVNASFYDVPWRDPFNPSLATSSGETFRASADDSAASPIYPDGTRLLVRAPETGASVIVRVNNAGPYFGDRLLDLSRGAAERLGLERRGVGQVEVMVLAAPSEDEAHYQAGRVYPPVPGYIGTFASLAAAVAAWSATQDAPGDGTAAGGTHSLGTSPAPSRIVVIPGRGGRARTTRVVLLPVKLRRAPVLRAAAVRKAMEKRKQASSRR